MAPHRYVIVSPVRNEAEHIGRVIESVSAQTIRPRQWVIVDDGSNDGTGEILYKAARVHDWITVVHRPDRGFRKTGGGVVETFYDGYKTIRDPNWDFIVKLDADLSFERDYFEQCLSYFDEDQRLGIGGGTVYVVKNGKPAVDSPSDPRFHVRGATKIYRRGCWEQIHPLVVAPGWDTIDEVNANMRGWRTRTFEAVPLLQHRGTGEVHGIWPNWFKNGLANYITGYHPLFMLGKCTKRLLKEPRFVASVALWAGFCSGYVTRKSVAAPTVVGYLRREQLRYVFGRRSIYRS